MTGHRRWLVVSLVLLILASSLGLFYPSPGSAGPAPAGDSLEDRFALITEVLGYIRQLYVSEVDESLLWQGALEGMVRALGDINSTYMPGDEFASFLEDLDGSFGGVGIQVGVEGEYIKVVRPIEGTPAHQAGLMAGDRIIEVDGESLVGVSLEEAVRRIRGREGTAVLLKVLREGESQPLLFNLTRARIQVPLLEYRLAEEGLGYIRIFNFNNGVGEQFSSALEELRGRGARGLVLDMRGNPGGLLDEAVKVAGALIPAGTIVQIVSRSGKEALSAPGGAVPLPLVVLIDGDSASAAEIVAGALRDHGLATLVGTRSLGKGTVQTVFGLEAGGGLKLTTARYLTPRGYSLDGQGLNPDVVVEPMKPGAPVEATWNLRRGLVGLDVLALQRSLNRLGFGVGAEDGIFGFQTVKGVQAFQRSRGLAPTGVVEKGTLEAINQALRETRDVQLEEALKILRRAAGSSTRL